MKVQKIDGIKKIVNENGVTIGDQTVSGGHHLVDNAFCECGEKLLIAPAIVASKKDHEEHGLIVTCYDHAHKSYFFEDLVCGVQLEHH